jgi:hypothetical protein
LRIQQIQTMKAPTLFVLIGTFSLSLAAFAADVDTSKLPPPSDQKNVTYAKDIKPILDKSCIKCHGEQKPKARLQLTSLESALKGSENGKVIEPGNSAKSRLVHSVGQLGHQDYWMPPPHNKANIPPLTKEQIGLIRAWIDQGAK